MIYLDNAATTPVLPEVFEAMKPFFMNDFANPASMYAPARKTRAAMQESRKTIADTLGAKETEIFFTSGGTESDNWVIKAAAEAGVRQGKRHLILSAIEHPAIRRSCEYLKEKGFTLTVLPVDSEGFVHLDDLKQALRSDTCLVSIMTANNEVGTIEPIQKLAEAAHENGSLFHTDAVQAYGHIPLDVNELGVDFLSASAHKFHGPPGIGFLYIRDGTKIGALLHGGTQERSRRAGTSNVPGIVGMAAAAKIALRDLAKNAQREMKLRDYLIERIENEVPEARLSGPRRCRLPGNVHFCFRGIQSETLLILLDESGICASGGSACSTGAQDESAVIKAMGIAPEYGRGALRLTLSEKTSKEEIDETVEILKSCLARLRKA